MSSGVNSREGIKNLKMIGRKIGLMGVVLVVGFTSWLVLDQFLRFVRPDLVYGASGIDILENSVRVPAPYAEFVGEAGVLDHDAHGFRNSDPCEPGEFNIAFFGGSTGYLGNPTIAQRLGQELEEALGIPTNVKNFSVVSSNHRQHLHLLLETQQLCEPDLVVFYGGYNEVVQPLYYDPRANYPFNFYITRETGSVVQALIKFSPTFALLEALGSRSGNSLSALSETRDRVQFGSQAWKDSIRNGYLDTIATARDVVSGFTGEGCAKQAMFRFAYQPYRVPEELQTVNQEVADFAAASSFGYDLSQTLESRQDLFLDPVHVNQRGNEIVADSLSQAVLQDSELVDAILACHR